MKLVSCVSPYYDLIRARSEPATYSVDNIAKPGGQTVGVGDSGSKESDGNDRSLLTTKPHSQLFSTKVLVTVLIRALHGAENPEGTEIPTGSWVETGKRLERKKKRDGTSWETESDRITFCISKVTKKSSYVSTNPM